MNERDQALVEKSKAIVGGKVIAAQVRELADDTITIELPDGRRFEAEGIAEGALWLCEVEGRSTTAVPATDPVACPFCGEQTDIVAFVDATWFYVAGHAVECREKCGARGPVRSTKELAIAAWEERK